MIIIVDVIATEIVAYEHDTTASLKEYSGIFFHPFNEFQKAVFTKLNLIEFH